MFDCRATRRGATPAPLATARALVGCVLIGCALVGCKDEKTRVPFLFAETPTAVVEGQTAVFYSIVNKDQVNNSVLAEYSADGGQTFQTAALAPGSPPLTQLQAKPEGERFNFFWDPQENLGPGLHREVVISLFGFGDGARASRSGSFTVDLTDRTVPLTALQGALTLKSASAVALSDGSILVAGIEAQGQAQTTLLRYRPNPGDAPTAGSISVGRTQLGVARLSDGAVLLAGGRSATGIDGTVERWAISRDEVTSTNLLGTLAVPRARPLVAPLKDGRALILGGEVSGGGTTDSVVLATPGTGLSAAYSSPLAARAGASATRLGDGRVLLAGGVGPGGLHTSVAFVSGPTVAEITTGAAVGAPRVEHAALLLPDGRVALVGGSLALGDDAQALSSVEIFDPTNGSASFLPPMSRNRRLPAAAYVDGAILVVGGTGAADAATTIERFEFSTMTWHSLAVSSGSSRVGAVAATVGAANVLVLGGDAAPELYYADADLVVGTFDVVRDLPQPRADHTATLLNDQSVLLVGGTTGIRLAQSSVEAFDPTTRTFSGRASLQRARSEHGATKTANGQVLVAGGIDQTGALISVAELFTPALNAWQDAGALSVPRRGATLSCFGPLGSPVYALIGGVDAAGNPVAEVEVWSDPQRSWSVFTSLPNPRKNHDVAITNYFFFVGPGDGAANGPQAELQRLNPFSSLALSSLPLVGGARAGAGLAFFREPNRLIVSGGRDASGAPRADLEMVEPDSQLPSLKTGTVAMAVARSEHRAVKLDDTFGQVLFVGGRGASGLAQDRAEILRLNSREDLATAQGTVSDTGDPYMNRARMRHTALKLNNRQVLIVGGVDERGSVIAGAELYRP